MDFIDVKHNAMWQEGSHADVLVIDDEESICEGCRQTLLAEGLETLTARNGEEGLKLVERIRPSVVVVDLKMPGMNGLEVLARISEMDNSIVSIVISGFGTIDTAVESMKTGAFDFINKPFDPEQLIEAVQRGMKLSDLRKKAEAPQAIARPVETAIEKPMTKQTMLLESLEILEKWYALGFERRDLMAELKYLEAEAAYHSESLGQIKKKEKAVHDLISDFMMVDKIIDKHEYKKEELVQILLDIQQEKQWLPRHVMRWLAARLQVPFAEILTIAEFYEAFSLEPKGKHQIQVCTGTACHVRGAPELLARISTVLGIKPGQTDPTQTFSLNTVHCMGCCALAPVIKIDNTYHSNPSMDQMRNIFDSYKEQEEETWKN